MSLAEYVVKKRVTVMMFTLGIILLGVIALKKLPQELFPRVSYPQITVVTDYANAAPEEIENLITKPIEESVGSVSGLKRIESISREGRSTVVIAFNWGQDIDFAALAVREKIDLIKERLPKEADDPVVLKFDPLSRPIMILSVTAQNMEPVRMKLLAEKMIKDNLEKVEGVASINLSGGVNREIQVNIDQGRLLAGHLSLLQTIQSIEDANVSYPAGSIKKGLYEYLIRTVGEFKSVREVEYAVAGVDTVQKIRREDTSFLEKGDEGPRQTLDSLRQEDRKEMMDKRLLLVKDIAEVVDGTAERTSVSRYNGKENLSLSVQKQANANTIEVVARLRKTLASLKVDLESRGLQANIIYDHSVFIKNSMDNLKSEAMQGGFLAFLVLFAFLRSFQASLLVTLSIPISVLGTFFLMSISGISLNTMSLGGLALAVGMIVDTSIVVVENIVRRRQLGEEAEAAAISGTREVTWAVIGSNLTTVAVFFPLIVFVPGFVGQIMKDLSWAIIYSQIISTIVPLTFVAMLTTKLAIELKEYKPWPWTKPLENMLRPDQPRSQHESFIGSALVLIFIAVIGAMMVIYPNLDREVLPKVDQGQFLIKLDMPIGTRIEITDRVAKRIEEASREIDIVKDIAVTIGAEKSRQGDIKIETLRTWQGIILVNLKKKRNRSSASVVDELRTRLQQIDLEEGTIEFVLQESEFQFAEGGSKPVLIEVKGYDFQKMGQVVSAIKTKLAEIPGVVDIQDDIAEPAWETKVEIEKSRAARYAVSPMDISLTAKAAIDGVVATKFHEQGREFDIRVRLSQKDKENVQNLNDLLLYSQALDQLVPLKEVATITKGLGPSEIRHLNQERATIVSASLKKNVQSKNVLNKVQTMLKNLRVAEHFPDFQANISGTFKEQKESYTMLIFAFALALILNYMIMAALFESFVQPFIIMVSVPLSFVGVLASLMITGISINVMSMFAVILLVGTVVNNAIVLIEYLNQLRAEGMDIVEAALTAAKVRTRPILMSSFTTIIGLLPLTLGLGEGSELRRPMAVASMGGMFSSTFLTLVVVPLFYILITYLSERLMGYDEALEEEEDEGDK